MFYCPKVYPHLSSSRILTTEYVSGIPIDKVDYDRLLQNEKDFLSRAMLRLCIREIFEFKFMQTDPNFSNFLYEPGSMKINLIDMGACRDYDSSFVLPYTELVAAAARHDRDGVLEKSRELGILTGHESEKMEKAHVDSVIVVGQPYKVEPYDFKNNSMTSDIAKEWL